jgi:hypothetical protein
MGLHGLDAHQQLSGNFAVGVTGSDELDHLSSQEAPGTAASVRDGANRQSAEPDLAPAGSRGVAVEQQAGPRHVRAGGVGETAGSARERFDGLAGKFPGGPATHASYSANRTPLAEPTRERLLVNRSRRDIEHRVDSILDVGWVRIPRSTVVILTRFLGHLITRETV